MNIFVVEYLDINSDAWTVDTVVEGDNALQMTEADVADEYIREVMMRSIMVIPHRIAEYDASVNGGKHPHGGDICSCKDLVKVHAVFTSHISESGMVEIIKYTDHYYRVLESINKKYNNHLDSIVGSEFIVNDLAMVLSTVMNNIHSLYRYSRYPSKQELFNDINSRDFIVIDDIQNTRIPYRLVPMDYFGFIKK